jgi:FPC/CPF motif-containing protein YcgG
MTSMKTFTTIAIAVLMLCTLGVSSASAQTGNCTSEACKTLILERDTLERLHYLKTQKPASYYNVIVLFETEDLRDVEFNKRINEIHNALVTGDVQKADDIVRQIANWFNDLEACEGSPDVSRCARDASAARERTR